TSAVKGVLMSENGRIIRTASSPFTYIIDGDARFLEPDAFCESCFSVIKELSECPEYEIAAVCSCHASGNLLLLDSENRPITPIVGWQTVVSQEDIDRVYTKEEQTAFYRTSGWPLGHGMVAADLAWLKVHRPELLDEAATVTMSAEYLNFQLTGKWGISHSMGTPSRIMDQERGVYNRPILEKLGIAGKFFPPIFDKGTVLGTVLPDMAGRLGVTEYTKVVLGSFDHPSGALGAGVLNEGELLLSCGTSWVELFPVSSREFALSTGGLVDRFALHGAPYCVMKSLTSVTEKINARRVHFFGKITHKEFDEYIAQSSLGCGGLRIDFTDDDFKRAENHSDGEIARAIIEGAALMLKDNLIALRECGLHADSITAIGGITNSPVCTRVLSEVLGQEIRVVNGQSAGAVGSCLLAGMGLGVYRDEKDAFETMYRANRA
ncbi:MAG: FGGY-family carbohydrate kinase, partial [Clostridia bacterium]|nr:FGGY-family carbohydrate kinase [Clostridia bacterium]